MINMNFFNFIKTQTEKSIENIYELDSLPEDASKAYFRKMRDVNNARFNDFKYSI